MLTTDRVPGEAEGAIVLRSALAQGPSRQEEAKWGRLTATQLSGLVPRPPWLPHIPNLFSLPFREHVQQSQERGKVSIVAVPHLIAIPPSLNASL